MSHKIPKEGTRIVAIDGPAGAGKSTVARAAAKRLGFAFLDTGAMYRAATLRAMRHDLSWDDEAALTRCAVAMNYEQKEIEGSTRIFLDGEDVSELIRSPEVTRHIFHLDQIPALRRHLVGLQQQFGHKQATVAEGRDMGTVVFPDALCKIYLDASLDCRVERRALEMEAKGLTVDRELLHREIRERDENNMKRAESPLRPADDAVLLDTTTKTPEQVIESIVKLALERLSP
ncbi:MAG: (d)CMP kinase [Candidatus Hydrogenedens sp.]|jgi:cytidylate kinase|nr:(d)CMP kinase [Candidatus Hydrogenedens sp.]